MAQTKTINLMTQKQYETLTRMIDISFVPQIIDFLYLDEDVDKSTDSQKAWKSTYTGGENYDFTFYNSITSAVDAFALATGLKTVSGSLDHLVKAQEMFCSSGLTTFNINLPNVEDGNYMFDSASKLTSFTVDTPNLKTATQMFAGCSSLTEVTKVYPKVVECEAMFYQTSLSSVDGMQLPMADNVNSIFQSSKALPEEVTIPADMFPVATKCQAILYDCQTVKKASFSLPEGRDLFALCGTSRNLEEITLYAPKATRLEAIGYQCTKLKKFYGENIDSIESGFCMFENCQSLRYFDCKDFSNVMWGTKMFHNAQLNKQSIQNICDKIRKNGWDPITIGYNSYLVTEEERDQYDEILRGYGWKPTWQPKYVEVEPDEGEEVHPQTTRLQQEVYNYWIKSEVHPSLLDSISKNVELFSTNLYKDSNNHVFVLSNGSVITANVNGEKKVNEEIDGVVYAFNEEEAAQLLNLTPYSL